MESNTALAGVAIFLFVGLISLIISYLFLWIGLGNIANKIAFSSFIIAFVGGLACCMGWGAEKGVECFKKYLRFGLFPKAGVTVGLALLAKQYLNFSNTGIGNIMISATYWPQLL